jgi:hypothetical protein
MRPIFFFFADKYSNKKRQTESWKGKGGKGKGGPATALEITVGSQVCLSTAPLYQVNNSFMLSVLDPSVHEPVTIHLPPSTVTGQFKKKTDI